MKTTQKLALHFLCALFLLCACAKAEPAIDVSTPSTVEVDAAGNSATIKFTSNTDWTVSTSQLWCRPSPASGAGGSGEVTVNVTLDPNTTYDDRTAIITIKAGGVEKTINLTQKAVSVLTVDGAEFEVPETGGQLVIPVKANVDYSVTTDADWIKVVSTKAVEDYNITLECEGNNSGDPRTATVNVSGGGINQTFTVSQKACEYIKITYIWSDRDDMELAVTDVLQIVRGWGGPSYRRSSYTAYFTTDLEVKNFDIACEEDAQGWVYKSFDVQYSSWMSAWSINITLDANPTTEPRTGHIRIIDKDTGYVSTELTVHQEGMPEGAVDIGLYYYFAECNLGASSPEEYGDYYAWGELEPKTTYTWDNYYWTGDNKYTTIEHYSGGGYSYKNSLDYEDDAAAQQLGYKGWTGQETEATWHIPSQWDFNELLETRDHPETHKWEWKTINGHAGWQITYLVNGNTLFLPAAGYIYDGGEVLSASSLGLYWTSDTRMPDNTDRAYYLRFESGECLIYSDGQKAAGKTIRPVTY